MNRLVNVLRGNRVYLLLALGCLVLLLRGLELRLPGITQFVNEDEIHHNYWLLENSSALGDFTVWQLQPLLEYILRIYLWFPFLALPVVVRYALSVFGLLVCAGVVWTLLPMGVSQKQQRAERAWKVVACTNSFIFSIALIFFYHLLPKSGSGVFIGLSARSLALFLLVSLIVIALLLVSLQAVLGKSHFRKLTESINNPIHIRWLALTAMLVYVCGTAVVLLCVYNRIALPDGLQPYFVITLPIQIAVILLSFHFF